MKKRKKSDNYEMRPIDRIINGAFYLLLGIIMLFCAFLFFATKGHCASNNANSLPYYVDYYKSTYFSDNFVVTGVNFDNYDMVWFSEYWTDWGDKQMYMFYLPSTYSITLKNHDLNNNVDYSNFDFTTDYAVIANTNNNRIYKITLQLNNQGKWYNLNTSTAYTNGTLSLLGRTSENINQYGYTPMIPYYLKDGVVLTDTVNNVVFTNGSPAPIIDYGHATPPNEFNGPVYTHGHSKPEHVPPTITVNNYTWTTYTPPTVDNSTLEKLLESLTNIVKYNATYIKDNLHNEFTNLINNIKNLTDYIGETIQYYGNLIIENIQNSITTFYNNMVSLFEPIPVALDYISQPLDMESLTNAVYSTQIFDDVDTCTTFANDAFGIYGTVAEPNTFKIPLDLRSISLLNITQIYYIDLSWLDGAKTAIRAFMWCVVTFGLLYSVIVDIPNMIRSSK